MPSHQRGPCSALAHEGACLPRCGSRCACPAPVQPAPALTPPRCLPSPRRARAGPTPQQARTRSRTPTHLTLKRPSPMRPAPGDLSGPLVHSLALLRLYLLQRACGPKLRRQGPEAMLPACRRLLLLHCASAGGGEAGGAAVPPPSGSAASPASPARGRPGSARLASGLRARQAQSRPPGEPGRRGRRTSSGVRWSSVLRLECSPRCMRCPDTRPALSPDHSS